MVHKRVLICIVFLALCSSMELWARSYENGTKRSRSAYAKFSKSKKRILAKKLIVDQSDFMPGVDEFSLALSYKLSYDDLQQEDEKIYNNQIGISGSYSFTRKTSIYSSLSIVHQTKDEKIVRENDTDNYHSVSNLNIGLVYNFKPQLIEYVSKSSSSFNLALPTSERSRIDKHKGSFSGSYFVSSTSWNKFSIYGRSTANFLWNSLKFSKYDDSLNRDWLLSNSFGVNYQALESLMFRVSMSSNNVRYLDKSWEGSFGNKFSILGNLYGVQVSASLSNNSYPENDRIDLTYFDKYRRLYSVGVSYVF